MHDFGGTNIHFIEELDPTDIVSSLKARGIENAHFNNGTFNLPRDIFAPNFLAAFQRILDLQKDRQSPLVVALNSNISMRDSFVGKPNEEELNDKLISQDERAENILSLLGTQYPYRQVVVILYDEQTPAELYGALRDSLNMLSLHKVGYGTNPKDKPIIGSKFFSFVHASPLYNDEKPAMHQETPQDHPTARTPDVVEKLTEEIGPHGQPYITTKGGLLMPVAKELRQYSATENDPRPAYQQS
ncbi:MAG: hypothetical protein AAF549_02690 [Pseudomonadota bacterium]